MSKKRGSLGRGLSVILGNHRTNINRDVAENTKRAGSTHNLLISEIKTNPFQPRTEFNKEKLHELSLSIEQLGIIQPITVRKLEKNQYQLISGERRYRASKIAGLKRIPAFIRTANDQQMLEMALVENIQRENLNPIEVALSYQRLIDECKLTQEGCSERVGKNRTTITNFLRLLKLPSIIQKGLSERKISVGHARALINIKSDDNQINIYHDALANGYSVREVEQIARTFTGTIYKRISKEKTNKTSHPFSYQKIIHDLSIKLDSSVELKRNKKGKGRIIIPFNTDKNFERIARLISK